MNPTWAAIAMAEATVAATFSACGRSAAHNAGSPGLTRRVGGVAHNLGLVPVICQLVEQFGGGVPIWALAAVVVPSS